VILLDFPVAALEANHLVPRVSEHLPFLRKDDVFPTGLLVRVMNQKHFHREPIPFFPHNARPGRALCSCLNKNTAWRGSNG
jgi:hypothetical protein